MMLELPNEILAHIVAQIDEPIALGRVTGVCHHLRAVAQAPSMWRKFYEEHIAHLLKQTGPDHLLRARYISPNNSADRDASNRIKLRLNDDRAMKIAASYIAKVYILHCAIDRNQLHKPCIGCQDAGSKECDIVQGACGHRYHLHCIQRWTHVRNVCPLDNCNWVSTNVTPASELIALSNEAGSDWMDLYYGEARLVSLLRREYAQANLGLVSGEYAQQVATLEGMGMWNRDIIIQELIDTHGSAARAAERLLSRN